MTKHVHIVSLDIPYPADYGGVIDIFYQLKAFAELGIDITLHCFYKDRKPAAALEKYCKKVFYYARSSSPLMLLNNKPWIVQSRTSNNLLENLKTDNAPILFHGMHCTALLNTQNLFDRKVVVRTHNVESLYYQSLALHERNIIRKLFFQRESKKLFEYERNLATCNTLAAISTKDLIFFENNYGAKNVSLIPPFVPFNKIVSSEGYGNYCLYHGNLSVNENEQAVIWLIKNVFSKLPFQLKIAGKKPGKRIVSIASKHENIELFPDPDREYLQSLVAHAHINVLPDFNNTGVKLKILNALFSGRHCITNSDEFNVDGVHYLKNDEDLADNFIAAIHKLMQVPFTSKDIVARENLLATTYNNRLNAIALENLLR